MKIECGELKICLPPVLSIIQNLLRESMKGTSVIIMLHLTKWSASTAVLKSVDPEVIFHQLPNAGKNIEWS